MAVVVEIGVAGLAGHLAAPRDEVVVGADEQEIVGRMIALQDRGEIGASHFSDSASTLRPKRASCAGLSMFTSSTWLARPRQTPTLYRRGPQHRHAVVNALSYCEPARLVAPATSTSRIALVDDGRPARRAAARALSRESIKDPVVVEGADLALRGGQIGRAAVSPCRYRPAVAPHSARRAAPASASG